MIMSFVRYEYEVRTGYKLKIINSEYLSAVLDEKAVDLQSTVMLDGRNLMNYQSRTLAVLFGEISNAHLSRLTKKHREVIEHCKFIMDTILSCPCSPNLIAGGVFELIRIGHIYEIHFFHTKIDYIVNDFPISRILNDHDDATTLPAMGYRSEYLFPRPCDLMVDACINIKKSSDMYAFSRFCEALQLKSYDFAQFRTKEKMSFLGIYKHRIEQKTQGMNF